MLCLNNDLCFWTKVDKFTLSCVMSRTYFIGKKEGNIRREGGQVSV